VFADVMYKLKGATNGSKERKDFMRKYYGIDVMRLIVLVLLGNGLIVLASAFSFPL
jgi:hypothetical protein